jgi:hypothetical protein
VKVKNAKEPKDFTKMAYGGYGSALENGRILYIDECRNRLKTDDIEYFALTLSLKIFRFLYETRTLPYDMSFVK